jgi:hypothetical protein
MTSVWRGERVAYSPDAEPVVRLDAAAIARDQPAEHRGIGIVDLMLPFGAPDRPLRCR